MGFFGMSGAGKEANGWARESGAWNKDQFQRSLADKQKFNDRGDLLTNWSTTFFKNRADQGIPSTQMVSANGRSALPGVDEANNRSWDRLGQARDTWGNTMNTVRGQLGQMGTANADEYGAVQGELDAGYDPANQREGAAHNFLVGDIYGTYGGLGNDTTNAYSDMAKKLELLNPAGQASTARVARSFAPEMASAGARLQRGGIDPNSLQAQSAFRGVEADRARAMDDAAAAATAGYVGASNQLAQGQLDRQTQLKLQRQQQADAETIRNLNANQNLGLSRMQSNIANKEQLFGRNRDLAQQGVQTNLMDWQTNANLLNAHNQQEQTALNNKLQQWNTGMGYTLANEGAKDQAAQTMAGIGQNQYGNMFGSGQLALGFNNAANQGYNTAYQREAANAGWGKKMLAGMAPGLVSLIPGVGQFAAPFVSAGLGGMGYGQQGGNGGSGWGSVFNTARNWFGNQGVDYDASGNPIYGG